jgi:hypothetical protein
LLVRLLSFLVVDGERLVVRKERGSTYDAMSGDGSVIADTLKTVGDVCRVGGDEEKETGAGGGRGNECGDRKVEVEVEVESCLLPGATSFGETGGVKLRSIKLA